MNISKKHKKHIYDVLWFKNFNEMLWYSHTHQVIVYHNKCFLKYPVDFTE